MARKTVNPSPQRQTTGFLSDAHISLLSDSSRSLLSQLGPSANDQDNDEKPHPQPAASDTSGLNGRMDSIISIASSINDTRVSCGELLDFGTATMVGLQDVRAERVPLQLSASRIPIRRSQAPDAQIFSPVPITIRRSGVIGGVNKRQPLASLSPNARSARPTQQKSDCTPTRNVTPIRSLLPVPRGGSTQYSSPLATSATNSSKKTGHRHRHAIVCLDAPVVSSADGQSPPISRSYPPRKSSLPLFQSIEEDDQRSGTNRTRKISPHQTIELGEGRWLSSRSHKERIKYESHDLLPSITGNRSFSHDAGRARKRSSNLRTSSLYRNALKNQTKQAVQMNSIPSAKDSARIQSPGSEMMLAAASDSDRIDESELPASTGARLEIGMGQVMQSAINSAPAGKPDQPIRDGYTTTERQSTERPNNSQTVSRGLNSPSHSISEPCLAYPSLELLDISVTAPNPIGLGSPISKEPTLRHSLPPPHQRMTDFEQADQHQSTSTGSEEAPPRANRNSLRSKLGLNNIRSLFGKSHAAGKHRRAPIPINKETEKDVTASAAKVIKTRTVSGVRPRRAQSQGQNRILVTAEGSPVTTSGRARQLGRDGQVEASNPHDPLASARKRCSLPAASTGLGRQLQRPHTYPPSSTGVTHDSQDELSTFTKATMSVLDSARQTSDHNRKERLLGLGKVMVKVITNAKEAEKAMEEAKVAAIQAKLSYMETRKSMLTVRGIVERWQKALTSA